MFKQFCENGFQGRVTLQVHSINVTSTTDAFSILSVFSIVVFYRWFILRSVWRSWREIRRWIGSPPIRNVTISTKDRKSGVKPRPTFNVSMTVYETSKTDSFLEVGDLSFGGFYHRFRAPLASPASPPLPICTGDLPLFGFLFTVLIICDRYRI